MANPNDIIYSQRNADGTRFVEKTFVPVANTLVMVSPCLELTSYTGSFNSGSGGVAASASWASHSLTSVNSETSDFALLAGEAINATYATSAQTSDFALLAGEAINSTTASFALSSSAAQFTNTSSYTINSVNSETSDFALLAGDAINSTNAQAADFALLAGEAINSTTASFAFSASYAPFTPTDVSVYLSSSWTGSNASQFAGTSSYATVAKNALTASYVSGSQITASSILVGTILPLASTIGTPSAPFTTVYAINFIGTSSYALNAGTLITTGSSYPITSSWAQSASFWNSSSIISLIGTKQNIITTGSSFAITASVSISSSYSSTSTSSSFTSTASYALNAGTLLISGSTYHITSSWALSSISSSYAQTSSYLNEGANIYLSQSYITSFTNSVEPSYRPATLFWDNDAKTYAMYTDHAGVALQVGQEQWVRAYAGENIPNGSPVYVYNSLNSLPCVKLALADGIITSSKAEVIGLATEDIFSGSIGIVTSLGQVHSVNTSQYTNGQLLYLSNTASGSLTGSMPNIPYNRVSIGYVLVSDSTEGIIQVNITNTGDVDYPYVGIVYTPTIVSSGGGIITVGTCSVNLCESSNGIGHIHNFNVPSASFNVTSSFLDVQYLVVDYNNGSPQYNIITDVNSIDDIQITPVSSFTIGTAGSLSYIDWDSSGTLLANKNNKRIIDLYGAQRASGLELGYSGSNITISAGTGYMGIKQITFTTSSTANLNQFVLIAHSASVWSGSFIGGWINDYYDNGTALTPVDNNKYVVNYVFRGIGSLNRSQVILSTQYNQYADAVASTVPSTPSEFKNISIFVGRIITQQGNSTPLLVESAFTTILSVAGITNHNDLLGLQGGTVNEYYHLPSASYSNIINGSSSYSLSSSYAVSSSYSSIATNAVSASYVLASNVYGYPSQIVSSSITASVGGSQIFSIVSSSVNVVYISSSGQVNINTTSPSQGARFYVSASRNQKSAIFEGSDSSGYNVWFKSDTAGFLLGKTGNSGFLQAVNGTGGASAHFACQTLLDSRMGVGVAIPNAKFQVAADTVQNGIFSVTSGSINLLTVSASGNTSLGPTTPVNRLDVVGNISASVITASLFFGTASFSNFALSASYAISSSYAITSSYSVSASTSTYSSILISPIKLVETNYVVAVSDSIVVATGSIPITLTLPSSISAIGRSYTFKNRNQYPMYLMSSDNSLIDGNTSITASYKNTSIQIQSSGTEWFIL